MASEIECNSAAIWLDRPGQSEEAYKPSLAGGMTVEVARGGVNRSVAGEQLDVPETATGSVYVARGSGNEAAPAGMRRAALDLKFGKHCDEPIDDAVWPHGASTK